MRLSLFLLFVYCTLPVWAEPESQAIDVVYKLSPIIYDVKGMGEWKTPTSAGQLRLVITRSEKQDEVFLQWVAWSKKGPQTIKSTIAIKEIQQAGRFKVTFIRRETIEGKRQIVLGLENLHDKSSSRAIIYVSGIGRYQCKLE